MQVSLLQPWLALLVVMLGNCGFWLYCFNRVNSTGLKRRITKRIEKAFIAVCFLIPIIVSVVDRAALSDWLLHQGGWWPAPTVLYGSWAIASIGACLVLGPGWLESRRWIAPPDALVSIEGTEVDVSKELAAQSDNRNRSANDRMTKFLAKLPGNQITQLDINRKTLQLKRSVPAANGLRIGHISDLHFTGQFSLEHYQYVVDRFMELEPDLIAITGDIIDYAKCLPWIEKALGRLNAPYGCMFLFGNHDCRLADIQEPSNILKSLGHLDIGESRHRIEAGTLVIDVLGNELPWLDRGSAHGNLQFELDSSTLRLGLSHSPDQNPWARKHRVDLLLAGHTHGGQVRFPLIGPIVAPSRYGSRYASGVFEFEPTIMHVSRGIAGTHPLRWRCKPEVSLLTLRTG